MSCSIFVTINYFMLKFDVHKSLAANEFIKNYQHWDDVFFHQYMYHIILAVAKSYHSVASSRGDWSHQQTTDQNRVWWHANWRQVNMPLHPDFCHKLAYRLLFSVWMLRRGGNFHPEAVGCDQNSPGAHSKPPHTILGSLHQPGVSCPSTKRLVTSYLGFSPIPTTLYHNTGIDADG